MEFLLFPKNSYYLTQGYKGATYSHAGRKALDVSAAGGGYKEVFAPFTGYVAKTFVNSRDAYTIWLVSSEKVLCADNKPHYVVMQLTHPEEIAKYKAGDTFRQNEFLMNDGDTGQATGKHLDIEVAIYDRKEDIKVGFYLTSAGTYGLINAVDPENYLVRKNDCKVLNDIYNGRRYYIKDIKEVENVRYDTGRYITLDNIRVRTGPGTNYAQKQVKDLTADGKRNATSNDLYAPAYYRKGTVFDAYEIITKDGEVWGKSPSGYINIIYKDEVNCEPIF